MRNRGIDISLGYHGQIATELPSTPSTSKVRYMICCHISYAVNLVLQTRCTHDTLRCSDRFQSTYLRHTHTLSVFFHERNPVRKHSVQFALYLFHPSFANNLCSIADNSFNDFPVFRLLEDCFPLRRCRRRVQLRRRRHPGVTYLKNSAFGHLLMQLVHSPI